MWKIGGIHVIKILGSKVWIVIQYVINLILKLIGTEIWIILNMGIYIGTVLYDMFYKHQALRQVFLYRYLLISMGIVIAS